MDTRLKYKRNNDILETLIEEAKEEVIHTPNNCDSMNECIVDE